MHSRLAGLQGAACSLKTATMAAQFISFSEAGGKAKDVGTCSHLCSWCPPLVRATRAPLVPLAADKCNSHVSCQRDEQAQAEFLGAVPGEGMGNLHMCTQLPEQQPRLTASDNTQGSQCK